MKLMKNAEFTEAHLEAYAKHLKDDYEAWTTDGRTIGVEFEPGMKYTKVILNTGGRSAHSFIDAKGDIWKAASWKAPAKNFTRGSIVLGAFKNITWAGCH